MNEEKALESAEFEIEVFRWFAKMFMLCPCDEWARDAIRQKYGVELPPDATRYLALQAMAAALGEEP